jgi:hypothetical protein
MTGPFAPNWESLAGNYHCPEWFRDAKFGMWAHWSAQCVPEQGDWYARQMYIQGNGQYNYHVRTYGHPSKFGFMELDNLWKAEQMAAGSADEPVRPGGREVFRLAGEPPRQFRQLQLQASRLELGQRGSQERHRRHLGQGRPQTRPALRRQQPLRPLLALVPNGLWLRCRPARGPGFATTPSL